MFFEGAMSEPPQREDLEFDGERCERETVGCRSPISSKQL